MPADYSKLSDQDLIALRNKDYGKLSDGALKLLYNQKNPGYNPNQTATNIDHAEDKIGSDFAKHVPDSIKDLIGVASSAITGRAKGAAMGALNDKLPESQAPDQDVEAAGEVAGSPITLAGLFGASKAPAAMMGMMPGVGKAAKFLGKWGSAGVAEEGGREALRKVTK